MMSRIFIMNAVVAFVLHLCWVGGALLLRRYWYTRTTEIHKHAFI
jgi:hypothetical protein